MTAIRFEDVTLSEAPRVDLEVVDGESRKHLWFELPSGSTLSYRAVAWALASTFAGAYTEYQFSAPLSVEELAKLERATGGTWVSPVDEYPGSQQAGDPDKIVLSFSGGLDSLAALALLGEKAHLVSVDFGAGLSRERDFFQQFGGAIVSTNIRGMERSWTFMGLGACLMRETFGAGTLAFGSILEASPWNFLQRNAPNSDHAVFRGAGFRGIAPVAGLTEFGTTALAALANPRLMGQALQSLADPHTEKFARKRHLLEIVERRYGIALDLPPLPTTLSKPVTFGRGFATDFLAPGMCKFAPEVFASWMSDPEAVVAAFSAENSCDFYFGWNPSVARGQGRSWEAPAVSTLMELGIRPYGFRDWDEIRAWVDAMKANHSFPAETW